MEIASDVWHDQYLYVDRLIYVRKGVDSGTRRHLSCGELIEQQALFSSVLALDVDDRCVLRTHYEGLQKYIGSCAGACCKIRECRKCETGIDAMGRGNFKKSEGLPKKSDRVCALHFAAADETCRRPRVGILARRS